jgi:membrane protease YdiL (CAAX protease family)
VLVALWTRAARPWSALGLAMPAGWRLAAGALVVLLAAVVFALQVRAIGRIGEAQRLALRERFRSVALILPHTAREHRWFRALALTAGVCEELLYRGFLVWAMRPWLGIAGATAASLALFTLGHSYQGAKGAVRSGLAGVVMAGLVLLTGSLIPSMLVHVIIDLGGGASGYRVLREPERGASEIDLAA